MEKSLNYENMGVYELREFARRVGVYSPTTKKRKELVEQIELALNGQLEQHPKTNKGRPPKAISKVDNFFETLIPNEFKTNEETFDGIVIFKNFDESESIKFEVYGYVQKTTSNEYFLINENTISIDYRTVYIPYNLVNTKLLSEGDFIVGKAVGKSSKAYCMLSEIKQINYGYEKQQTIKVDDFVSSKNQLTKNVFEGERYLVESTENIKNFIDEINSDLDVFAKQDFEAFMLASNITPEQKYYVENNFKGHLFVSSFEDEMAKTATNITNCINHAMALLKCGKRVVIFCHKVLDVLNILNLYYVAQGKPVVFGKTLDSIQQVKKLFALGRTVGGKASITIYATTTDIENEFIRNQLAPILTDKE